MGRITLDDSRAGLGSFPRDYAVVARDDTGDVLAVDEQGKVWCFAHGSGEWMSSRLLAFDTVALLHEHVAFQEQFELPPHEVELAALRARQQAIRQFMKGRRGAPYSRLDAEGALEDLRTEIEDKRFWASKKGQGLAACQALGRQCEKALRDAGASGEWMCRAARPDGSVLAVQGNFAAPWCTERVADLLAPLVGRRELKFVQVSRPPA